MKNARLNVRRVCAANQKGFTLIEILVVIGMLALLSTVVLVAINPLRQFAEARNSQRESNVEAILNAVSARIADNQGMFISSTTELSDTCRTALPNAFHFIGKSTLDIRSCLVPNYIPELPYDPAAGSNTCWSGNCSAQPSENYDTQYQISQDFDTGRVTVCAPHSVETAIASSSEFCLTR